MKNSDQKVNDLGEKVNEIESKTVVRLSNIYANSDKPFINWFKIRSKNLPHKCKDLVSLKILMKSR